MANIYVARRRLKIGDEWREPGEEVPEAATWRNLHSYLSSGAVTLVQTDTVQSFAAKQRIPNDDQLDWAQEPIPKSARTHHDQLAGHGEPNVGTPTRKVRVSRAKKTETKEES